RERGQTADPAQATADTPPLPPRICGPGSAPVPGGTALREHSAWSPVICEIPRPPWRTASAPNRQIPVENGLRCCPDRVSGHPPEPRGSHQTSPAARALRQETIVRRDSPALRD